MTTSPIDIRDAREDEIGRLKRVTWEAYAQFEDVMAPRAWEGLSGAVEAALSALGSETQKIVAVAGGEIVGSVLLFPPDVDVYRGSTRPSSAPELRLLAVVPSARGRGIGRRLVEECIRRSGEMGADALGLHTSRSMAGAIELYRSIGFERNPDLDFQPDGGELVTAYRLPLK